MTSHMPRVITKSDPSRLTIEWATGGESAWAAWELRGICPCAQCVDEMSGVRKHDPSTVSTSITTQEVKMVGNYALAISFSDSHATGIFTFKMLRAHDEQRSATSSEG